MKDIKDIDPIAQDGLAALQVFLKQQQIWQGQTTSNGENFGVDQGNVFAIIYDENELKAEGLDYTKPAWTAEQFMSVDTVADMKGFPIRTLVALNLQNPARQKQVDRLIRKMMRSFIYHVFLAAGGILTLLGVLFLVGSCIYVKKTLF